MSFRLSFCALLLAVGTAAAQAPRHPLDGLSPQEHWTVYEVLHAAGKVDSATRFGNVALREPDKAEVLGWRPGTRFSRGATVHLTQGGKGYDGVVDLLGRRLVEWRDVPAAQHMMTRDELGLISELILGDERVRAAIRKRGITDLHLVPMLGHRLRLHGRPRRARPPASCTASAGTGAGR